MKMFDFFGDKSFYTIIVFLILLGLLGKYVSDTFLESRDLSVGIYTFILILPEFLALIMTRLFSFSLILSIFLILAVLWSANRLMNIRTQMHDNLKLAKDETVSGEKVSTKNLVNEKWQKVVELVNSNNPDSFKLAILECDIILSDLLEKMGYMQESISEKLKAVEPSDFTNIEAAWEAHKIRNMIAHEGSDFAINEREAKRVIGLYELVFKEFSYI